MDRSDPPPNLGLPPLQTNPTATVRQLQQEGSGVVQQLQQEGSGAVHQLQQEGSGVVQQLQNLQQQGSSYIHQLQHLSPQGALAAVANRVLSPSQSQSQSQPQPRTESTPTATDPHLRPATSSTEKFGYDDSGDDSSPRREKGDPYDRPGVTIAPPPRARSVRNGSTYRPGMEGISSPMRRRGSGLDWVVPVADAGDKYVVRIRVSPPSLSSPRCMLIAGYVMLM